MEKNWLHRIGKGILAGMLAVSGAASVFTMAPRSVEAASEYKLLGAVTDVEKDGNIVYVTYAGGGKTKITFLENDIFRFTWILMVILQSIRHRIQKIIRLRSFSRAMIRMNTANLFRM